MKSCRGTAPLRWRVAAAAGFALGLISAAQAESVTYRGTVVTDIKLGSRNYHDAALKLTFSGDTADIVPVTDSSGCLLYTSDAADE